jgi:hypothetical protein
MESTPRLYETLVAMLGQHEAWKDRRHLQTLAWMMVGVIESGQIHLSSWAVYVQGRAQYAASIIRRFRRWLANERLDLPALYNPLVQQALAEWGSHRMYVALDTSMLWNTYCLIRLSLVYRGRAIPLVWEVIEPPSASIAYAVYAQLLDQLAQLLWGQTGSVIVLADRGFADTELMAHVSRLGWHWRIRIKSSFWVYRSGHPRCKVNRFFVAPGQAQFWAGVRITEQQFGPVHLAIGQPIGETERWVVLSDEPVSKETFVEYGLRFDIEENFLDDKSNGFQLESSRLRSAPVLERLCLVLALTTLYLVSQGTRVVDNGQRRCVDPHWFRGRSYLKIGWHWVKRALATGQALSTRWYLSSQPDPQPAMASRRQAAQRSPPVFLEEVAQAA